MQTFQEWLQNRDAQLFNEIDLQRRSFLKTLGKGLGLAAATSLVPNLRGEEKPKETSTYRDEVLGYFIDETKKRIKFHVFKDDKGKVEIGPDGKPMGELKFIDDLDNNQGLDFFQWHAKKIQNIKKDGTEISAKDVVSIIKKLEKELNMDFADKYPNNVKMFTDSVLNYLLGMIDTNTLKPMEMNKLKPYINNMRTGLYGITDGPPKDYWTKELERLMKK
jgi:hypothetical protein